MTARTFFTCTVDGCEGKHIARGLCSKHYKRLQVIGNLTPIPSTHLERLTAGLVRMPSGCLEWTGLTKRQGYGQINVKGKMLMTHRMAWTLANGPIAGGLYVLHHCDNPPCAQTEPTEGYPDGHLFLGTKADNNADMAAKGRHGQGSKTHCPQGHPYDEANTYIRSDRPAGGRACIACQRSRTVQRRSALRQEMAS